MRLTDIKFQIPQVIKSKITGGVRKLNEINQYPNFCKKQNIYILIIIIRSNYNNELNHVVPTLNRSKKFENLLEHYSNNNYKGTILVMDSSNLNEKNNILSIKKFSLLKIKYVYLAKKIYRKEYLKYVQRIKTKYTVCSGDDDFFIVNSLKYLITFLDKNNSYHGACGIGLSCFKDKNKYRTYLYKNLQDLNDKNATERIKKQFSSEGYTVAHYSIENL